eukprot:301170-Karenia_brevis.AAC.1
MPPLLAQAATASRLGFCVVLCVARENRTVPCTRPPLSQLLGMTTVEGVPDPPNSPMGSEFGDNGSQYGNQHGSGA